ncbi:MAG: ABC transporter substrate-binding protein [Burkholderiales bacterium]|nr:ABC transporter substrate-binding protein [Burkholderiales bacterium]
MRVFYEIWHEPLMTIGGTHLISDVLAACGARNVFELAQGFAFAVSAEQLYARAPDAIVVSTFAGNEMLAASRWQRFAPLAAVQAGRVYVIDSALANRMGPRLAEGAAILCALVDRARGAGIEACRRGAERAGDKRQVNRCASSAPPRRARRRVVWPSRGGG